MPPPVVRWRPPLSQPGRPPQSPLGKRQRWSPLGKSRLPRHRSLPPRNLPPQPRQPPPPLSQPPQPLQVKVTRGGAGAGGKQVWQGVRAGDSSPPTSSSHPASSSDVPSAPLLLALEDVSDSSVTVSWEPPEKLGRLGLQGYVLELCREGGELWAKPFVLPGEVGLGVVATGPAVGPVRGRYRRRKSKGSPQPTHLPLLAHPDGPRRQGDVQMTSGDPPQPHPRPPAPRIL